MAPAAPPAPPPSRIHIDWDEAYRRHGYELTRYEEILESHEKESRISLTPGAVQMIFIPLLEELNRGQRLEFFEVSETFKSIIAEVAAEPDARDSDRQRSSWSVVRAYWRRWCNIPPICGPTAKEKAPVKP